MARDVSEWIGPRDETAPPPRVKLRIIIRQGDRCAHCNRRLGVAGETIEFDHITALINGGENREGNLQALCGMCHAAKTREDVAEKSATARKRKKHLGLNRPKRKMPYRKFDGTPVWNNGD